MLVSSRATNLLLVLVLGVGIAVVAMLATGVRGGPLDPPGTPNPTDSVRLPGTPINGQFVINSPGHYYLTRDVRVTGAQTALTINASEVSVDLGGFTLDGTDEPGGFGILVSGTQSVVRVTNGTIKDFQVGIDAGNDSRVSIDNVRAVSNVRGIQVGNFGRISECVASENTETGIYLPLITGQSTVTDCVITGNGAGVGIDGTLHVVKDSVIQGSSQWDLHISQGSRITVRDNTIDNMRIELDSSLNYIFDNVCVQSSISDASGAVTKYIPRVSSDPHFNPGC